MVQKQVRCSLLTDAPTKQSFVWHDRLGAFEADWHDHPKGQLMYAEDGYMHIMVEGRTLLLPSWYCAWMPAGTRHFIWSRNPEVYIRTIYFEREHCMQLSQQPCVFPASDLLREMIVYTQRWHNADTTDEENVFLEAITGVLPGEMRKHVPVCLPSTTHEQLTEVVTYMQNHLSDKWSQEEVARQFGFSTRTLTRMFRTYLGTSFSVYGKMARMMKALELIEGGADNVSALADATGYESIATFSNNFLEICGCRPLQFIQQKRNRV